MEGEQSPAVWWGRGGCTLSPFWCKMVGVMAGAPAATVGHQQERYAADREITPGPLGPQSHWTS